MAAILTRAQAVTLQERCRPKPLEPIGSLKGYYYRPKEAFNKSYADLLSSKVGGCPWRIAIIALLTRTVAGATGWSSKAHVYAAWQAFQTILERWPTPTDLKQAQSIQVIPLLEGLSYPHKRWRAIVKFNAAWLKDDWEDILDLPFVGAEVAILMQKHTAKL